MSEKTRKPSITLSICETAALLDETERAVRMRIFRKQIPHRRWRGRVFILRDELEQFLRSLDGVGVEEALQHVEGGE